MAHTLAVGDHIIDRIDVMYLGKMVELGTTSDIYDRPLHPYTMALLSAIPVPQVGAKRRERIILPGDVPSPINPPSGCPFHTRCLYAQPSCKVNEPPFADIGGGHYLACPVQPFKHQRSKAAVLSKQPAKR